MAGLWRGVERWLLDLQADRPRLARYLQVAWWISNLFVFFGFILALLVYAGVIRI